MKNEDTHRDAHKRYNIFHRYVPMIVTSSFFTSSPTSSASEIYIHSFVQPSTVPLIFSTQYRFNNFFLILSTFS